MFRLTAEYAPRGDQPQATEDLTRFVRAGRRHSVLRGVTGSGKTYTIANLVANTGRPTLVLSPNKTLAAQLFSEFKAFFPDNAVEYFVSYYDYYQPEAYIPQSDTYIEKDALINDEIDRMRHSATRSLLERRDVVVVASVSCIYGIGAPETYREMHLSLREGESLDRDEIVRRLVAVQYERNDYDFHRGTFRVRGDVVEIFPANEESHALRVELWGDVVEAIHRIDPLKGAVLERLPEVRVYPASHYVTPAEQLDRAMGTIQEELGERLAFLKTRNRLLEAQRLEQRTLFDMEMLRELGYCHGIENYSRHLTGRRPGEPPPVLIEYLPSDALVIIDESHVAVPQIRGMYYGDRSRKEALVEYGFRLHSDIDTLDRVALIRDLRLGKFDCLIGINLLREGLDIPEVSLVAILDADKEGYLRSGTSLIQTAGRAARNLNGEVIMYADHVTDSMAKTLRETDRRRALQAQYNEEHGITPETIRSSIRELLQTVYERDYYTVEVETPAKETFESPADLERRITELDTQMKDAARRLDFEQAAELRDRIRALRRQQVS